MATQNAEKASSVTSNDRSYASSDLTASTPLTPISPAYIAQTSNSAGKKKKKSKSKKKKATTEVSKTSPSQVQSLHDTFAQRRLFEIKNTPNRGLGIFATQDLPRGTRIMVDVAALRIEGINAEVDEVMEAYKKLDACEQAQLMTLEKHYRGDALGIVKIINDMAKNKFLKAKSDLERLPYGEGPRICGETDDDADAETEIDLKGEIASRNVLQLPEGLEVIKLEDSDDETQKADTISEVDSDSSAEIAHAERHMKRNRLPSNVQTISFPDTNVNAPDEGQIRAMTPAQRADALIEANKELEKLAYKEESREVAGVICMNHFKLADQSDSIDEPKPFVGLFMTAARLNNDCTPNANNVYNSAIGAMTVHAVKDIKAGEEITINYTNAFFPAQERRDRCFKLTNLQCDCKACDLSTAEGRRLDARRKLMHEHVLNLEYFLRDDHIEGRNLNGIDMKRRGNELIRLMIEDGIAGAHLAQARCQQTRVCAGLGEKKQAIMHAQKGIEEARIVMGDDNPEFITTKAMLDDIIARGGKLPPKKPTLAIEAVPRGKENAKGKAKGASVDQAGIDSDSDDDVNIKIKGKVKAKETDPDTESIEDVVIKQPSKAKKGKGKKGATTDLSWVKAVLEEKKESARRADEQNIANILGQQMGFGSMTRLE